MSVEQKEQCVVLVTNRSHLQRCFLTIWQLRVFGRYRGDVVIVVGDDLKALVPTISRSLMNPIVKHFPEIDRSQTLTKLRAAKNTSDVVFEKPFQFHKIFIFDVFFTQWKKVLYVDTKMRVFNPIRPLLELDCTNSLIAHSDAYPDYTRKLESQFNTQDFPDLTRDIDALVPLANDYFQTGMMIFDTSIISQSTVDELDALSRRFVNSNSNEQAIMNLWAQSQGLWRRLPTSAIQGKFLYDYWEREPNSPDDYVLLKYPRVTSGNPFRRLADSLFSIYWTTFSRKIPQLGYP